MLPRILLARSIGNAGPKVGHFAGALNFVNSILDTLAQKRADIHVHFGIG